MDFCTYYFGILFIVTKAYRLTGASSTSWQREASGSMKRTLNYTITISNPLVGKFSTATENQVRFATVWLCHKTL